MRKGRWSFWWPVIVWLLAATLIVVRAGGGHVLAADRAAGVSLSVFDHEGQLLIWWNQRAQAIQSAQTGQLEIWDGDLYAAVNLDQRAMREGSISYARSRARVRIRLSLRQAGGAEYEEFTRYVGHEGGL